MTLEDVALRFAAAGVSSSAEEALASLKRCRPARAPVYKDRDTYALDPYDDEVSFWLFRLGLRPARGAALRPVPSAAPLPSSDQPLTVALVDEAFREGVPNTWSAQRVAVAVLDAHQAPMSVDEVIAFVLARSRWSPLHPESAQYWRSGAVIVRDDDGRWELNQTHDVIRSTREAVCQRVGDVRRWAARRPDSAAMAANDRRIERERQAHARELAAMRRVIVHAAPATGPRALALLDVSARSVTTFIGDEIGSAIQRLSAYEIIVAVGVRSLLRELGVDAGQRRLAEIGPPQKTLRLNRRGRSLTITTALLVQGSCGISRPLEDERIMREYVRSGAHSKLRRRLEADAKSLYALYQYGRLHGCVRLRWGFVDEMLPAPWVHRDESTLYHLLKDAHDRGVPLEVVVGSAPSWATPWSRAQRAYAATDAWHHPSLLVDEQGYEIPRANVQLARLLEGSRAPE